MLFPSPPGGKGKGRILIRDHRRRTFAGPGEICSLFHRTSFLPMRHAQKEMLLSSLDGIHGSLMDDPCISLSQRNGRIHIPVSGESGSPCRSGGLGKFCGMLPGFRRHGFQAPGQPRLVAPRIAPVILPGGFEFPTDRRPALIDAAADLFADRPGQGDAPGRVTLGPFHGNEKVVNPDRHLRRNPTGREFIGFRPVK